MKTPTPCLLSSLGALAIALVLGVELAAGAAGSDRLMAVAAQIRGEALRLNQGAVGRPLPLAAHWNTGVVKDSFSPGYQIRMIEQGHHLLPWFNWPEIEAPVTDPRWTDYYEGPITRAAELKLPVSFISTQWESLMSSDKAYFDLPADQNPNVVTPEGRVRPEVSPLGPVGPWREVGARWTSSPWMKKLQEWYPDPLLVLLVSNNEHARLPWTRLEEDRRFLERYGTGHDDAFKRKIAADGWIERYRALQQGLRDGLTNPNWKRNALGIGYDAFGPPHFGRWEGWPEYSLWTPGRIDPNPLAWQGGSPSFYVHNWNDCTDYTVHSPQVEAMNWVFMRDEAVRLNPGFWFEISTWDGHAPGEANDKRKFYIQRRQSFSPERYGGMVQFGMWLLRPRVVREFRGWQETLAEGEPYFLPIVAAVDRIYANKTLAAFWRKGELVANRANLHPYQSNIPKEYQDRDRWFLLATSLDPERPWSLSTELPVYSLALVLGQAPERRWLVYAHAPTGERPAVSISMNNSR